MPDVVPGVGAYVDPSNVYCSLADLKAMLGITDSSQDDALNQALAAASRQIDRYCGRRFWADQEAQVRYFDTTDPWRVYVDDIATLDDLVVAFDADGTGTYATSFDEGVDFYLGPVNGPQMVPAWPYEEIVAVTGSAGFFASYGSRMPVKVTAKFGWPAVPSDVDQACCLQAIQLWKAKDAVFGVASFGEFGPLRVRSALNPIAEGLLSPYARPAVG